MIELDSEQMKERTRRLYACQRIIEKKHNMRVICIDFHSIPLDNSNIIVSYQLIGMHVKKDYRKIILIMSEIIKESDRFLNYKRTD